MKKISVIIATLFAALLAASSCETKSAYQTQLDSALAAIEADKYSDAFASIDEIFSNGARLTASDAIAGLQLSLTAYNLDFHKQGQDKDLTTNIERCKKIAGYLQKAKSFPQEAVAEANKVAMEANNGTDILDSAQQLVSSLPELEAQLGETLKKAAETEPAAAANSSTPEIPSKTN